MSDGMMISLNTAPDCPLTLLTKHQVYRTMYLWDEMLKRRRI